MRLIDRIRLWRIKRIQNKINKLIDIRNDSMNNWCGTIYYNISYDISMLLDKIKNIQDKVRYEI